MGNTNSRTNTYQQYYEAMQKKQPIQIPDDISPYDILGVSKNFTWDELKDAYKRQARLVHPDKGGNEQLFNLVTNAFKILAHDFKLKQKDKQHHELKQNYQFDTKNNLAPSPSYRPELIQEHNFNHKFNSVFEENKFEDDDDDNIKGYGHMMEKSSKNREDFEVPKVMKKYNNEKFNDIFNRTAPVSKEVVIYKEPEPLVLTRKLNFTEIGKTTDDFSTDTTKKTNLQYTDYMKAHTTSRLVDPRSIQQRKVYKTVEEYDAERTKIANKKLTEQEIKYQKLMEIKKEKEEEERLKRINNRDMRLNDYYEKTSKLFLK